MGVPPACHVPRPAILAKQGHPCTLCITSNCVIRRLPCKGQLHPSTLYMLGKSSISYHRKLNAFYNETLNATMKLLKQHRVPTTKLLKSHAKPMVLEALL